MNNVSIKVCMVDKFFNACTMGKEKEVMFAQKVQQTCHNLTQEVEVIKIKKEKDKDESNEDEAKVIICIYIYVREE